MSLMIIAMTGILLGFLCVMVGFFMEGTDSRVESAGAKEKRARAPKKRMVVHGRKAA